MIADIADRLLIVLPVHEEAAFQVPARYGAHGS
jgi:hypothetical protein